MRNGFISIITGFGIILMLICPTAQALLINENDWYYSATTNSEEGLDITGARYDNKYVFMQLATDYIEIERTSSSGVEDMKRYDIGSWHVYSSLQSQNMGTYTKVTITYDTTHDSKTVYFQQEFQSSQNGYCNFINSQKISTGSGNYFWHVNTFLDPAVDGMYNDKPQFYDFTNNGAWGDVRNELSIGDDFTRSANGYKVKIEGGNGNEDIRIDMPQTDKNVVVIQKYTSMDSDPVWANSGDDPWNTDLSLWIQIEKDTNAGASVYDSSNIQIYMEEWG